LQRKKQSHERHFWQKPAVNLSTLGETPAEHPYLPNPAPIEVNGDGFAFLQTSSERVGVVHSLDVQNREELRLDTARKAGSNPAAWTSSAGTGGAGLQNPRSLPAPGHGAADLT